MINKGLVNVVPGKTKKFVPGNPEEIIKLIESQDLPQGLIEEIIEAYHLLGDNKINETGVSKDALDILRNSREPIFISVRTSAITEDIYNSGNEIKPESFGAGDFSNNIFWVGGSDGWGMACGNSPNVVITYTSGGNSGGIESNMDTGTWYHFCTVFDQSNNILKIYKNGLSIFSNSSYTDNSAIIAGDDIYIGANGASTNFFDGIIDELIFTNDVLTDAEVLDIYANGLR